MKKRWKPKLKKRWTPVFKPVTYSVVESFGPEFIKELGYDPRDRLSKPKKISDIMRLRKALRIR